MEVLLRAQTERNETFEQRVRHFEMLEQHMSTSSPFSSPWEYHIRALVLSSLHLQTEVVHHS